MADERLDAFGNPIHQVAEVAVDPHVLPLHLVSAGGVEPRSVDDNNKTTPQIRDEAERARANFIAKYPDLAGKLPPFDASNPDALIKDRDAVLALTAAEDGAKFQKEAMGAVVALAGAGALLGGVAAGENQSAGVISPEQLENNKLPINKEFEKLLAGLGAGDKQAFSLITGGNDVKNLDSLKPNDGLPSLAAALEQTKSTSAGRSITA